MEEAVYKLSGYRLLIVDACEGTRLLYKALFEQEGAHVQIASSGIDALQQFALYAPDAVICDIALPGLDGIALLHQIRTHALIAKRQTPIVAATAWEPGLIANSTTAAQFDAWFIKPVNLEEIVAQVARLAALHRSWTTSRATRLHRNSQRFARFRSVAQLRFPQLPLTNLEPDLNPAV